MDSHMGFACLRHLLQQPFPCSVASLWACLHLQTMAVKLAMVGQQEKHLAFMKFYKYRGASLMEEPTTVNGNMIQDFAE